MIGVIYIYYPRADPTEIYPDDRVPPETRFIFIYFKLIYIKLIINALHIQTKKLNTPYINPMTIFELQNVNSQALT